MELEISKDDEEEIVAEPGVGLSLFENDVELVILLKDSVQVVLKLELESVERTVGLVVESEDVELEISGDEVKGIMADSRVELPLL
jgi:hypothetical protein